MRSFKQHQSYLAEGSGPSATQYESIITVGYNQGSPPYTEANAKDKPAFKNVAHFFPAYNNQAKNLGKQFRAGVTSGVMHQHGAGKDSTSSFWKTESGKGKDTPKTDMYTRSHNISLKKKGGSQLMSSAKKESIATLKAALEMTGENREISKLITDIDTKFTNIVIGGYKGDFEKKKGQFANMPAKEYKKKAQEFIDADKMHKDLSNTLATAIENDTTGTLRQNICYIATTGYKKFPKGSRGIANKLIEFNPDTGQITHNFDTGTPTAMSSSMINMAGATSFYCAFKTGSKNPYSSLRTKTGLFDDYTPTLNELIIETLIDDLKLDSRTLLSEGYGFLTEAGWISNLFSKGASMMSKAGRSVANWLSNVVSKIVAGAKKVFKKIVNLGKRAFEALTNFLGLVMTNAKIRVSGVAAGFADK